MGSHDHQSLLRSAEGVEAAERAAEEVLWDWDIAGDRVTLDPRAARWLDAPLSAPDTLARAVLDRMEDRDVDPVRAAIRRHVDEGARLDIDARFRDSHGTLRWHRIRGEAWRDTGGRPLRIVGTISALNAAASDRAVKAGLLARTQRLEAANSLLRRNLETQTARLVNLERTAQHLTQAERLGHIGSYDVEWSDSAVYRRSDEFFTILGRNPERGRLSLDEFIETVVHPDDRARVSAVYTTALQGGGLVDTEYRILRPDGEERWLRDVGERIVDEAGRVVGFGGVAQDVTEQHAAEARRRDEEALVRLGRLASGIAHEVRSPIAGIITALQVMADRRRADDEERAVIDLALDRLVGLSTLTSDLLTYAKPVRLERSPASVLEIARRSATWIRHTPDYAGIDLQIAGSPDEWNVDARALGRVIGNLLTNACQAMNGRGQLQVEVLTGPDLCEICVHDSGPGIAAEVLPRLFEPFVTTKREGAGLGLSISRKIVEAHGGRLEIADRPGGGTTARITLPRR